MSSDNLSHRDKLKVIIAENVTQVEQMQHQLQMASQKLLLRADQLEHITKTWAADKKEMAMTVSKATIKSDKLALQTEEILRKGNKVLQKETE